MQGSHVTQAHTDPAIQWSGLLTRLDDVRRDAVVRALRRSASTGWPASGPGVELLVAYALGEITSQQYVAGILRSWGVVLHRRSNVPVPVEHAPTPEREPDRPPEPLPVRWRREDAVQAYVTGRIDVGEFLRIARS